MSTKVITGKNTRFSYLHVTEPQAINDGTPKYSVSLIVPKSDKVTMLRNGMASYSATTD